MKRIASYIIWGLTALFLIPPFFMLISGNNYVGAGVSFVFIVSFSFFGLWLFKRGTPARPLVNNTFEIAPQVPVLDTAPTQPLSNAVRPVKASSIECCKVNPLTKKHSLRLLKRFIAFDFETTGLSYRNGDEIIEMSAIIYNNGKPTDEFHSLINPMRHIPDRATKVNNITNDMVSNAPVIADVLPDFLSFVENSILVAHNASFDIGFLVNACEQYRLSTQLEYVDTLTVSRKVFPNLENHKLGTVCNHIGHDIENAHRSTHDAHACAQILLTAIEMHFNIK